MKALKITLLLALFLSVSSQTDQKPTQDSVDTYETTKTQYKLIAHTRVGSTIPTQG